MAQLEEKQSTINGKTFREMFCDKFRCPPAEFERELLLRVVPSYTRLLARITQSLRPNFFESEYRALSGIGDLKSRRLVFDEAQRIPDDYKRNRHPGFMRMVLHMRISGRRLLKVNSAVW